MLKWIGIWNIIYYYNPLGSFIIRSCYCTKTFLTCSVPLYYKNNEIKMEKITIWSLIIFPSTSILLSLKSTPMEFIKLWLKLFSVYWSIMHDFPTPLSPNSNILNKKLLGLKIRKLLFILGILLFCLHLWIILFNGK